MSTTTLKLRALEKSDLPFVHELNNDRQIMSYWFEEPYESYIELEDLYLKHIHDQSERRFIAEDGDGKSIGLVELVEITRIHSRAEFQIIIAPDSQGKGYAKPVTYLAINYAFRVLNLNKLYLVVALNNTAAIKVYRSCGFVEEGHLVEEFFVNGHYQNALRMFQLQQEYIKRTDLQEQQ